MTRPPARFGEVPSPIPGARRFVLACDHGLTEGDLTGDAASPRMDRGRILEDLASRHVIRYGCDCAASLHPLVAEARR